MLVRYCIIFASSLVVELDDDNYDMFWSVFVAVAHLFLVVLVSTKALLEELIPACAEWDNISIIYSRDSYSINLT